MGLMQEALLTASDSQKPTMSIAKLRRTQHLQG
jgi:hypothetical protein